MNLAYAYAVPPVRPGAPLSAIVRHALCDAAEAVAARDLRWPAVLEQLKMLRAAGRRSVRIVDAACGDGALLLPILGRARTLGFVAIEARGVDRDAAALTRARRAAAAMADLAIAVEFDRGSVETALREEAAFPADILLYAADRTEMARFAALARRAGDMVLGGHHRAAGQ
ncbi:SAM-dependent methyltransferase [Sphingomonas sp. 22176]|uniref:SAM-dependent methyltransferase n=1 Tax=Sphingomonas sp. 22176 TaxID=3453884 RepID=UPI003F8364CE